MFSELLNFKKTLEFSLWGICNLCFPKLHFFPDFSSLCIWRQCHFYKHYTIDFLYFFLGALNHQGIYIDYDLLKMNHLTLLIWMINASSLLFVCDCWAATSTTMSSAEMATEDTAEVIKAAVERKCFVCYSCKRVETSQSVPCSEDEDQCMVSTPSKKKYYEIFCSRQRRCSWKPSRKKTQPTPIWAFYEFVLLSPSECPGLGWMLT